MKQIILTLILLSALRISAQYQKPDYILPSPNAANLGMYGEIPVSHFTGIPNINIPIYTLTEGIISVPINLSYYASGVRPDQHPGWVGQNWSLNAGGVITRVVKDLPDDYHNLNKTIEFTLDVPDSDFILALNYTEQKGNQLGYYYSHSFVEDYSRETVMDYVDGAVQVKDTEPDEFIFNFGGHTGKFFLSENGEWKVQSDQNLKVTLNGLIKVPTILSGNLNPTVYARLGMFHISTFKGFTITTDDGTQYIFGAEETGESTDAIEYSIPFNEQHKTEWTASSWYLKSIIDPYGKKIDFTYEPDDYICQMGVSFQYSAADDVCYYYGEDPVKKTTEMWTNDELQEEYDAFVANIQPGCIEHCTHYPNSGCQKTDGTGFPCRFLLDLHFIEYTNSFLTPKYGSYSGSLIRPVYLKKIESSNIELDFNREDTKELKYDNQVFTRAWRKKDYKQDIRNIMDEVESFLSAGASSNPLQVIGMMWGQIFPGLSDLTSMDDMLNQINENIQNRLLLEYYQYWPYLYEKANSDGIDDMLNMMVWKKLSSINIKSKLDDALNYTYELKYDDGPTQRLFLSEVVKDNMKYRFSYYGGELPGYCVEKVDHWGFANNRTSFLTKPRNTIFHRYLREATSISTLEHTNYYMQREPGSLEVTQAGSLKEIIYPTGGKTEFIYQLNDYSKFVNNDLELSDVEGIKSVTGGLRIFQTKNYNGSYSENPLVKTYYYVKNYSEGVDLNALSSSGILAGIPDYYVHVGYDNSASISSSATRKNIFSSQSYTPLSVNADGSHIGYSEVVEVNPNGSYIIHYYTNYEDYDGTVHLDTRTDERIFPEFTPYIPVSSKGLERGRFLKSSYYKSGGVPIKEVKQEYNQLGDFFVNGLDFKVLTSNCLGTTVLYHSVTPYKKYYYGYLRDKLEVTDYDKEGNNPVTTLTNYDYNAYDLLSTITYTSLNQNDVLTTTYKYPFDLLSEPFMDDLFNEYRIGEIIQKSIFKNSNPIGVEKNIYKKEHNKIVTDEIQISSTNEAGLKPELKFDSHDIIGNVEELHKIDDISTSYLWGYNKTYPVAKIENATYQDVRDALTAIGSSLETIESLSIGADDDKNLRDLFEELRNASHTSGSILYNAQITSYTYDPLVGITSVTDPNGITSYYEYDDFGRLKQIKDAEGNVLEDYTYQYKEEKIWGN